MTVNALFIKLLLVIFVGGIIGAEREYRSKSAGFRTIILICLGSFLFTSFSVLIGPQSPDRIAANIVTGIGFLGAGVIFQSDKKINGITTAAVIWATAALGMGIALGYYTVVLIATGIVMASLLLFTKLEELIDHWNLFRTYKIVSAYHQDLLKKYEQTMKECNLRFKMNGQARKDGYVSGCWLVQGHEKNHDRFVNLILHDESVKDFEF